MSSKSMSFKARINNYAKKNHIPAQVVLQNVMFERFLERLSKSEYKDKFVIKGGMLGSALVGLDTRATMDLDTTLRRLTLTEWEIMDAVTAICGIDLQDGVSFNINSIDSIRKDDDYGGYRVKLEASFEQIVTPLSIDVSNGDVITPEAVEYVISSIMDESTTISLWGYNVETVLAEKAETILYRSTTNTRPRDFYDIYILVKEREYDAVVFQNAFRATAEHRNTWQIIKDYEPIIARIEQSDALSEMWEKYRRSFHYAKDISFEDTIIALQKLLAN